MSESPGGFRLAVYGTRVHGLKGFRVLGLGLGFRAGLFRVQIFGLWGYLGLRVEGLK